MHNGMKWKLFFKLEMICWPGKRFWLKGMVFELESFPPLLSMKTLKNIRTLVFLWTLEFSFFEFFWISEFSERFWLSFWLFGILMHIEYVDCCFYLLGNLEHACGVCRRTPPHTFCFIPELTGGKKWNNKKWKQKCTVKRLWEKQ